VDLFEAHFQRLYRYLSRVSGDPELAADVAQDAFAKLYGRGSLPDSPEAWLITVALISPNAASTRTRRLRLLTPAARGGPRRPAPFSRRGNGSEDTRRQVARHWIECRRRERNMLCFGRKGTATVTSAHALHVNETAWASSGASAQGVREIYGESTDHLDRNGFSGSCTASSRRPRSARRVSISPGVRVQAASRRGGAGGEGGERAAQMIDSRARRSRRGCGAPRRAHDGCSRAQRASLLRRAAAFVLVAGSRELHTRFQGRLAKVGPQHHGEDGRPAGEERRFA